MAKRIEMVTGVPATWILNMGTAMELPQGAGMATMQALLEDQISDITHPIVRRYAEQGVAAALQSAVTDVNDHLASPITEHRRRANAEKRC